jgi:hypothetical protein
VQRYLDESGPGRANRDMLEAGAATVHDSDVDYSFGPESPSPKQPAERWQVLYRDDELQITHRGHADPEQREQIRLAAELIRNILSKK